MGRRALGMGAVYRVHSALSQRVVAALESDANGYYMLWLAAKDPRKAETFLRGSQKQAPGRRLRATEVSLLFDTEASEARGRQGRLGDRVRIPRRILPDLLGTVFDVPRAATRRW